jgi:hypothetical protein
MSKGSYIKNRRKRQLRAQVVHNCRFCGEPFLAWAAKYVFCSGECEGAWRNRRQAAMMNARRRRAEAERGSGKLVWPEVAREEVSV